MTSCVKKKFFVGADLSIGDLIFMICGNDEGFNVRSENVGLVVRANKKAKMVRWLDRKRTWTIWYEDGAIFQSSSMVSWELHKR